MDLSIVKHGEPRDYRKGNWTVDETMVLIQAKKMDEERRMKSEKGKPAELRWKWVEDYCWNNSCFRSQNQCNDKWDNLMRDFKKVREYEAGRSVDHKSSYWTIEKNERKDKNLPSNMLPQIYEALLEVMEKKGTQRVVLTSSGASVPVNIVADKSTSRVLLGQQSILPSQPVPVNQAPSMLQPFPSPAPAPTALPFSQPLPTVDSDTSEYSGSPAKRRRRRKSSGEGTSGAASGATTLQEVGSAIAKSASMIAEAIRSCEKKEEIRHRQMLSLQERRLQIEESKVEINRRGINGLVDAVNKLANSILALAAHKNPSPPSSK